MILVVDLLVCTHKPALEMVAVSCGITVIPGAVELYKVPHMK
jgi:hypothetical protein